MPYSSFFKLVNCVLCLYDIANQMSTALKRGSETTRNVRTEQPLPNPTIIFVSPIDFFYCSVFHCISKSIVSYNHRSTSFPLILWCIFYSFFWPSLIVNSLHLSLLYMLPISNRFVPVNTLPVLLLISSFQPLDIRHALLKKFILTLSIRFLSPFVICLC